MFIGYIKEMMRYPVKSFSGEKVKEARVMQYGLYGDRSHCFIDESRGGKYLTITQFPHMVKYKAKFIGDELDEKYPTVEIISPERHRYYWGEEQLIRELEHKSKRKLSMTIFPPTNVPFGAIEEEHLLLVTDASIDELAKLHGKRAIDYRRFRPNLYISLKEKVPFIEENWFGKRLKIGNDTEVELKRHCERCMIVTIDPERGNNDPTLLKTIIDNRNNHFGVYATVRKTGKIMVGDPIYLQT